MTLKPPLFARIKECLDIKSLAKDICDCLSLGDEKYILSCLKKIKRGKTYPTLLLGQYIFEKGDGEQSYYDAFSLMRQAVSPLYPSSYGLLGYMYYHGLGTPQNFQMACDLYINLVDAMMALGHSKAHRRR